MATYSSQGKMHHPRQNRLLAALPETDYQRLLPVLEYFTLPLGARIYESGYTMEHVFFPTTGIISLLNVMENGASVEIAATGKEGVVGISLFGWGEYTSSRAMVRAAGHAYRLPARLLKQEIERDGELQHLLQRFTLALITQMTRTAECNGQHSLVQRLCRVLLVSLDRLATNELTITQELIASLLGVRRPDVTYAVGALQEAGLINFNRGKITVLDRPNLEQRACECYSAIHQETYRLFIGAPVLIGPGIS